jgi:hypothetical protein
MVGLVRKEAIALPTKMYATIAYIDSSTRRDDVDFHVSRRYDSDSMWQYCRAVVEHARRSFIQLLDITVLSENGEQVWNWRSESALSL